jgi:hypothetical protein
MPKTTHGLYRGLAKSEYHTRLPREHKVWMSMKRRVAFPRNECYQNTTICPEWLESFEAFLRDMGKAPSDKHSIDRIDNSKGYTPDNCRWATNVEQQRNKTNNTIIEWNGESKCLAEWCDELRLKLGVSRNTINERFRHGWTVERAFTTPCQRKPKQ